MCKMHSEYYMPLYFAGWFCSCYNSLDIDGWDLSLQLLLNSQKCRRDRYKINYC